MNPIPQSGTRRAASWPSSWITTSGGAGLVMTIHEFIKKVREARRGDPARLLSASLLAITVPKSRAIGIRRSPAATIQRGATMLGNDD